MIEVEAIGDVATGALLGGAVEPSTGAAGARTATGAAVGADGHTHEGACLNCATPLAGAYCHACGQHAHVHRTLTAFFHDLLHSVFHFEGKFWATLPLLAWRPGELTRRYIAGERARFVSPMALFLFSVFLMFAVLGSVGNMGGVSKGKIGSDLRANLAKEQATLTALERQRATIVARHLPTAEIDKSIKSRREDVTMLRTLNERGVLDGSVVRMSDDMPKWIREPVEEAGRNPDLLLYKLRNNAYKWSWALIPLSVPFLWLLFPFSRRFRLYDHMVFVTYSLSFMTMLVIVAALLSAAGLSGAVAVAMFIPSVHMFRQLKGAYGLTRPGALWRTVVLTLFAFAAAILFVAMVLGLGLFE